MTARFLPAGDTALLVELADLDAVLALFASMNADPPRGVVELVPAAKTLAVTFDQHVTSASRLASEIALRDLTGHAPASGREIEIPVTYDGQDLAGVAALTGLSVAEVIARHTGTGWRAAFNGFAPGFCYLSGGDPALHVPRLQSPRTAIPAGSVALAGAFSGVYPQESPGGWQLIGTTTARMWDLSRTPPALVAPGDLVKFVDCAKRPASQKPAMNSRPAEKPLLPGRPTARLDVIDAPFPVQFQDGGRLDQLAQGVAASGAADMGAFRSLNRLLGNPAGTPAIEIGAGPLHLRATTPCTIAITGAGRRITLNDQDTFTTHQAVAVDAGDSIHITSPSSGSFSYLGARGGFEVEPVLGSAATDTLAHIGPPPLQAGDWIALAGRPAQSLGPAEPVPVLPRPGETVVLDVVMGPRADWFSAKTLALFTSQDWIVTPRSSRIGKRLEGASALMRANDRELPSEAAMTGAIQVPHSGQPVLFLADHPLTGGYPVIATVAAHHLDLAAQAPPGAKLRFRPCAPFSEIAPVSPEVS
ncbi:MAG: 5-oxoprolinase/urea amidolyase family protein [Paracoccus denitrificans]|uniref:5-oxoprolinase/urea amidolyase family protein n=1 Tax=Paracoccus denitrificans TaxID=266 RepID=A0A533I2U9_PARDE|nr:MAG: 5-oxoprolinase/urea amidolyase family protein [Paracoccus denitrificans]